MSVLRETQSFFLHAPKIQIKIVENFNSGTVGNFVNYNIPVRRSRGKQRQIYIEIFVPPGMKIRFHTLLRTYEHISRPDLGGAIRCDF